MHVFAFKRPIILAIKLSILNNNVNQLKNKHHIFLSKGANLNILNVSNSSLMLKIYPT